MSRFNKTGKCHGVLLVLMGSLAGQSAFAQEAESGQASHDSQNASAALSHAGGGEMAMGHHAMAHPFFAHMGIPDGPGEANVRLTALWRVGHEESGADGGLHIEAGLLPRWGFHFRSDVVTANGFGAGHGDGGHGEEDEPEEEHEESEAGHGHVPPTELMLMFSVLQSEDKTRGISVFGQLAWPVVRGAEEAEETITTAAGIGGGPRPSVSKPTVRDSGQGRAQPQSGRSRLE